MRTSLLIGLLLSLLLVSGGWWYANRQTNDQVCIALCIDDPLTEEIECLSPCEDLPNA